MQYIFEYHDVEQSDRLEDYTKQKLDKLKDRFQDVIRADVFFKTENTTSNETGRICNIRLSLPGPRVFTEANNVDFIESINEATSELKRMLTKRKEKFQSH